MFKWDDEDDENHLEYIPKHDDNAIIKPELLKEPILIIKESPP